MAHMYMSPSTTHAIHGGKKLLRLVDEVELHLHLSLRRHFNLDVERFKLAIESSFVLLNIIVAVAAQKIAGQTANWGAAWIDELFFS